MGFEPAARGELGGDAGDQQEDADGEGAENPSRFKVALEHEAIEQGQDKDQDRRLGEERGAAWSCDGDEIEERGRLLLRRSSACGWNQRDTVWIGLGRSWNLLR